MGEWLELAAEGSRGYLAVPASGSGPGVLVLHAWWGLTPTFTDICDRLAKEGYVALAPGLYPDGSTTDSIARAEELVAAHDSSPGIAESIVLAAVDQLRALPAVTGDSIGAIGFSLGGYWALHASQVRPDDISAVVTVYSTGGGDFGAARAAYLGHFAEDDDFEPVESVKALEAAIRDAGRDVTFHLYPGTGHWFIEPDRPDAFNPEAAKLVWDRTLAFLQNHLT